MTQPFDIDFDFTRDSRNYWKDFWRDEVLGGGKADPDSASQTLRRYHQMLWSKPLPNGEMMELEDGGKAFYLRWKDMYFGSDSFIVSHRYYRNRELLAKVKESIPDYREFIESFIRKADTIGGFILFPQMKSSINQRKGCHTRICDRWDLTLECIRRYYNGEDSPLRACLEKNKAYFDLFVDFKGFVDFFFLQDCVDESYEHVTMWLDTELFETNPIAKDVKSYIQWIERELEFVQKRNRRIAEYAQRHFPFLHLKVSGEGGYVEIIQEGDKYIYHSNEAGLADFLDEEDMKDMELDRTEAYGTLTEALSRVSGGLMRHGRVRCMSDKVRSLYWGR